MLFRSVLLLASSLHNLGSQEVDDLTQEVNLVAKNTNSHEVRVHNVGDSWNDSQQIDWYPLQTDFYRTIQFTVRVDSVANPSDIVSSELAMIWSGNVSSQDTTFSADLVSDDFSLVDDVPEAVVNFQYQSNTIVFRDGCKSRNGAGEPRVATNQHLPNIPFEGVPLPLCQRDRPG